ncbi:MMPL family transporter [Asanoa sp. WMMD1127]|uniref:MMPL family transporter n=1 Tax=Asanoa sp. WMMD1127 TaxID=3016107 RepID=UPI0024172C67|nr:MMPL family transporter [Asanoa sp. WMMD1127]MDG4826635.1 MMPL family transporter [Asanoa sp. WMMD1127]
MWTEWILRHRRLVMLGWLVLAVIGGALAPRAIDRLSYDFSFPGQPAYEANQRIQETFGGGGDVDPLVVTVTLPEGKTFDDPGVRDELAAAFGRLQRPDWRVASPLDVADADAFVRDDTAFALVYPPLTPGPAPYAAALPQLEGALAGVTVGGAQPLVTGVDPLNESGGGSDRPIIVEIALGAGGALIVLALAFGSLLALVPLLMAAVAITTTFLLVLALTAGLDVSFIVQYLVGLIGLGVAIDYALLLVMRWREERAGGADNEQAVRTAMATAGRAVVFSGVTVAISLLALIVLPLPFLRSVGLGGLLIPLVSVLVAVTLLPALLASVGPRLEWPRRKLPKTESRSWHAIGGFVVRHRWLSAVLATAALVVMALPVFGLRLGSPELAAIGGGDSPAAVGYQNLAEAGAAGALRPIEVVTTDPAAAERLAGVEGVWEVVAPNGPGWTAGDQRLVPVLLTEDPASPAGAATVDRIRAAAPGEVGGTAAQDADAVDAIYGDSWWVLALVVVITFALLARALRSIWLPIKALLLNVVSIAAAYGLTVLIWQDGYGSEALFGTESSGSVTVWVPIAAFSFLFGLSMDYEVFILSRIREGHDAGLSTDEATVHGIAYTGRLVTSAALILVLAFIALSTVPVVDVKIFATTLALGIALDATIVRGILTPALVAAFGRVNWWWPGRRSA